MRQKSNTPETPSERLVRDIRRATRKQYSAEEKIRIVLDGLRGEVTIAELCRREGIAESLYYSWSKEFLEAGKRRLAGDTARAGNQQRGQGSQASGPGAERGRRRAGPRTATAQKKHDRGWGTTRHEISRIRKARDHPHRRAVSPACAAHAGQARRSAGLVLSLV